MLEGIDVSSHNPDIDWRRASQSIDFALVKRTESIDYTNPLSGRQLAGARAHGLLVGHYHYARPSRNRSDAEAEFFAASLESVLLAGDNVVLDLEEPGENVSEWALTFCDRIRQLVGRTPWIYTGNWYLEEQNVRRPELAQFPLWLASWQPTKPPTPPPWDKIVVWQYTARGTVPGITGAVDRNRFFGANLDWLTLAGATQSTDPTLYGLMVTLRGYSAEIYADVWSDARRETVAAELLQWATAIEELAQTSHRPG